MEELALRRESEKVKVDKTGEERSQMMNRTIEMGSEVLKDGGNDGEMVSA